MKKIILEVVFASLFLVSAFQSSANLKPGTVYTEGQSLYVHALNGLHLRNFPDMHSEIITTLTYGDELLICEDQSLKAQQNIQMGWFTGQWVKVSYHGLEGYVFDAFISSLPVPEIIYDVDDCTNPVMLLNSYIDNEMDVGAEEDTLIHRISDEYSQTKVQKQLTAGARVVYRSFESGYSTELYLPELRTLDAYNLLRGLFVGCQSLEYIIDKAIFIKNEDGAIAEIKAQGISIKQLGREVVIKTTKRNPFICRFVDGEN